MAEYFAGLNNWISTKIVGGESGGYFVLAITVLLSAFGWYAVGKWLQPTDAGVQFLLALLRTLFTLLPALAGFWIANSQQRAVQEKMASDLEKLRREMSDYEKLVSVEYELRTMESLSKVARNAVMTTANTAKDLYVAIADIQGDSPGKRMLVERFKNHSNSVMTTLLAVQEQMNEIGTAVADKLSAHEEKPITERKTDNSQGGLELAKKMIEARGVGDGLKMFSSTLEQAQMLQADLNSNAVQLKDNNELLGVK